MKQIVLKNKILIITAIWQRHDLTDIVLSYYGKLAARSGGRLLLLAVGSEGEKSRKLCEKNGWKYIERSNYIISHKLTAVVQEAKNLDFDFMIAIGSDDLISLSLIEFYDKVYSRESNYMLGLKDLYLYMMRSKKSYYFPGYQSMKTIGAGRCFSRTILDKLNWKPWSDFAIQRGLDSRCSSILLHLGIQERVLRMEVSKGVCIDIKHPEVAITKEANILAVSSESDNILKRKFPLQYARIKLLNSKHT